MAGRSNIGKEKLRDVYGDKFVVLVRYMILAAESKRFVTYAELNKLLGVSIEDLRDFAGYLGDFCYENNLPYLNSLIINSTNGMPGEDYFEWLDEGKEAWGKYVASCMSEFHITMDNKKRFENTTGKNDVIESFLNS